MISVWFLLSVWIYCVYGQPRDCDAYIGKRLEWTNVNNTGSTPSLIAGWMELFQNGDIDVYNYARSIIEKGKYTLKEEDNNVECILQTELLGATECITFSPTLDHRSFVGCYVINGPCLPYCSHAVPTQWMAAVIMD